MLESSDRSQTIEIIYEHQPDARSTFRSAKESVVIGRPKPGSSIDLDLSPDSRVSRPHAQVGVDDAGTWIEDLDSKYGTLVNNRNIKGHGRWRVNADDIIIIGDTRLRVTSAAAPLAEARNDSPRPLSAAAPESSAIETPAACTIASGELPKHQLIGPGAVVGDFEVQELIGQGGMGRVYLAWQAQPICRQVALKVIGIEVDSQEILARFQLEQQALALMNHEYIARVYEAGTTADGAPYFAMEYVCGMPITEYCDTHRLTVAARVGLLREVCLAMEHAHQRGVIHRDLKPRNVLVTRQEERTVPKIIDFGLARTFDPLVGRLVHTKVGQFLGTPEYMAPEQAALGARVVDARADVYGLGVILYELLIGSLPFPCAALRAGGIEGMRAILAEVIPPKPSERLATDGMVHEIAKERQTSARRLFQELRRDLDWIVLKALQKDPSHRYASTLALADDLGRYLASTPVAARSWSPGYLFGRFMSRWRRKMVAGGHDPPSASSA